MDHGSYTVGWICALSTELAAAVAMLDERHDPLPQNSHDQNNYTLGRIGVHNVAIACLPYGVTGTTSAAIVASHIRSTFPSIEFGLMVGVGGGAPSAKDDIRLGDVVVSKPDRTSGGVIQYDFGKTVQEGRFMRTGSLNRPPTALLSAVNTLQGMHRMEEPKLTNHLTEMTRKYPKMQEDGTYPGVQHDQLFESQYNHLEDDDTCTHCNHHHTISRPVRSDNAPRVHYGLIASGNQVMRDGVTRERLRQELNVLCFEMEAAGLMGDFPCLVIRGICDYADTHKNKRWQPYAAAVAAAYAKELVCVIPANQVAGSRRVGETSADERHKDFRVQFRLTGLPVTGKFVDRDTEMSEIEDSLLPLSPQDGRKVHVLHGLGGIGKTQLAIAYCRKHQGVYSMILWVNGNSKDTLSQSLAAFATHIEIDSRPESAGKVMGHSQDTVEKANTVLRWLALEGNRQWLIVFDNVDRDYQADLEDPQAYNIECFLPAADQGSILITTRLPNLGALGTATKVTRVGSEQALRILMHNARLSLPTPDIESLLERLGGLPLALVQAGRYMYETGTSCQRYLRLYITSWSELQADIPQLRDYTNGSVQTTWSISYECVKQCDPTAAKLLQLWAYLDNQDLWFDLLKRGSRGSGNPVWFQDLVRSEIGFRKVIKILLAYSLVESYQGTESYSIHPVVHDWCMESISIDKSDLIILASTIVGLAVPSHKEPEYWVLERRLLPHTNRFVKRLSTINILDVIDSEDSYEAFHNLGLLFADQGKLTEAENMYQRALDGYEKAWGPEYTSTLNTINNLGTLYQDQGKLVEAEKLYQRALDRKEEILGPGHISTLYTVNNLGSLYQSQGKLVDAEKMYQRALDGKEKVLGPDYTSTLNTVYNLGRVYRDQGKLVEAEKMFQRALDGKEKAWGSDHTSTLDTVNSLGILYQDQSKLAEAEKMFRRALDGYEKAWGSEHTSTLHSANNLATLYYNQGKLAEAEEMYQRALDGYEKALGPDHTSTLATVKNLSILF